MNILNSSHYNITETNYKTDNGVSVGIVLHILAQILLCFIGTVIQVKLIHVSYKDKDKCWKIHVVHSVVLIIQFAFSISFKAILHFIPLLSQHVGSWVYYVASFITFYCIYSIVAHSLVVSVIKYLFIVHNEKIRKWNETTIMYCILIINILHPLFLMIPNIATSYWGSRESLNFCFGMIGEESGKFNSSVDTHEKLFWCVFQNSNSEDTDAFYIFKRCLCFIGTIVNIVINSNIVEGYFFFKIFRKMRR